MAAVDSVAVVEATALGLGIGPVGLGLRLGALGLGLARVNECWGGLGLGIGHVGLRLGGARQG